MSATFQPAVSQSVVDLRADLDESRDLDVTLERGALAIRLAQGRKNIWLPIALNGTEIGALRFGANAGTVGAVHAWSDHAGTIGVEFSTAIGPMRSAITLGDDGTLRCKTSLLPAAETMLTEWPRDVLLHAETGTVVTHQRGLRSGIVFAQSDDPRPFSVFYFQNFSTLNDFFTVTKQTPAGTVGGDWPELGYAQPAGEPCVLPAAREFVISDAVVTFATDAPRSEDAIARLYLDLFAQTYLSIERPATTYHPWTERAEAALRDLVASPETTFIRQGRRYLKPYVGDDTKPPESMVQFTVAVNAGEYDRWRRAEGRLAPMLRATASSFFSDDLDCVVRWLPGETFDAAQADDNMSHEAMDSWYLHHSIFNVFRFAREGDAQARRLFERSLPYLIRVAHRFNYRWPIFFNLKTLDVIRGEAKPGSGGETDVAGLYALVMIHAYEMFGNADFLHEAEAAAARLTGLGFNLAYQLNTTGFAAEAALRLWTITNDRSYLGIAETCIANIFDNLWMWECTYEHAAHYRTFFGLFPLRDAPYIAPYEELEAHAKFYEFLALGGDEVRPSLRLLIGEFQKYSLDRCWFYYPDTLPVDALAEAARNGRVERSLSVPLEDLQDGREQSGQVGQEIYGAGLPFVLTARHYMRIADGAALMYCNYPAFDYRAADDGTAEWNVAGDPRCEAELRVLPCASSASLIVNAWTWAGRVPVPLRGVSTPEGHALFTVRGGMRISVRCAEAADTNADDGIAIGIPRDWART